MRSGRPWRLWSRRAGRGASVRRATCGGRWTASSGAIATARLGARYHRSMERGGGRRSCSSAGRGWAPGSVCWGWRRNAASSSVGRCSTGPRSGHTPRRRERAKGGQQRGARPPRGARALARRLRHESLCCRRRPWPGDRLCASAGRSPRTATGARVTMPPAPGADVGGR